MTERLSTLGSMSEGEWEEYFLEFGGNAAPSPRVVDWELTGSCQYRCEWCWGPDHAIGTSGSMSTIEVMRSMTLFSITNINQRFVLTGGEPMLRPDIVDIIDHACGSVDETVLSTTGDTLSSTSKGDLAWSALARRPHGSTVAVPLHASDIGLNSLLMPRVSSTVHDRLEIVADTLMRAHSLGIFATLRTTVTGLQDAKSILDIPDMLADKGVDLSWLRWKIYQYDPYVGPRRSATTVTKYSITDVAFDEVGANVAREYRGVLRSISLHPIRNSVNNYVIIGPDGVARIVSADVEGQPREVYIRDKDGDLLRFVDHPHEVMDEIAAEMPAQLWHPDLLDEDELEELARQPYRR